jgi:hypothetical protein
MFFCVLQVRKLNLGQKKAHLIEIQVNGGSVSDKVDFATKLFEKAVTVDSVFNVNEMIDTIAITKVGCLSIQKVAYCRGCSSCDLTWRGVPVATAAAAACGCKRRQQCSSAVMAAGSSIHLSGTGVCRPAAKSAHSIRAPHNRKRHKLPQRLWA